LLLSISTELWMTGAGWFCQMKPKLLGWGQMGGLGYLKLITPHATGWNFGQIDRLTGPVAQWSSHM